MKLQWPWVSRKKYEALEDALGAAYGRVITRSTALERIVRLETPNCAHIGKKACRIAREALGR